jgi:hypothetical protein
MIHFFCGRARPARLASLALSWALVAGPAQAVRVDDLYAASAPVADASPEATRTALVEALRRVLVKVTGSESAGRDPMVMSQFGDPSAIVQQFRRDPAGSLWAQFDAVAVRKGLALAGLPVWGEDRPATVVWLAYDTGGGERDVLGSGEASGPVATALRRDLLAAAASYAVPLVLPLRDSEDLAAVTYADLWGDFSEPVVRASARYEAEAVLIGRARLFPAGMTDVRWTLMLHEERQEWRGDVAAGPAGLAERMAQRLASSTSADLQAVRFQVAGIRTLADYGLVLNYLQSLDAIESVQLGHVANDAMIFDLKLRGGREQLTRSLAVGRVVIPLAAAPVGGAGPVAATRPPELTYQLNAAP